MLPCLTIGRASPESVSKALQMVFRDLSADARQQYVRLLEEGIGSGRISAEGLLEARRGGGLVGAVFCQTQPGRTALVWPSRIAPGEPAETAVRLLEAATELCVRQRVRVVQALLESIAQADDVVLRAHGYQALAELIYLVSQADAFPRAQPRGALEFEPYCAANHARLVSILEATYEGTLDCPQLNGVRDLEDILEGYRATGASGAAPWLIARHQRGDVGCLLLADHPQDDHWELVYMGLIGSARGRGWGTEIARYAQWLTAWAGRTRLVVAVDAANAPGLRAYRATGFREWDRRVVYLKILPGAAADDVGIDAP